MSKNHLRCYVFVPGLCSLVNYPGDVVEETLESVGDDPSWMNGSDEMAEGGMFEVGSWEELRALIGGEPEEE